MNVVLILLGIVLLLGLPATTFFVGRTWGRLAGVRMMRSLTATPECAHVFGKWEPQQRHTATEYDTYRGRTEKFSPVLRRTCELCGWTEDKKVPLT